jgi:anaerobic selenocysteine-containing dehydrogenase
VTPLKRSGPSGKGEIHPISWDEALERVATEIERVKHRYGSSALFVPYGTGSSNQLNGSNVARRLMYLYGGSQGFTTRTPGQQPTLPRQLSTVPLLLVTNARIG